MTEGAEPVEQIGNLTLDDDGRGRKAGNPGTGGRAEAGGTRRTPRPGRQASRW